MKKHKSTSKRTSTAFTTVILLIICALAMSACAKKDSKSHLSGPESSAEDSMTSDMTESSEVPSSSEETTLPSETTTESVPTETSDTTPSSSETLPTPTPTPAPTNTPTPKPTKAPNTPTPKPKENTPTPVPQETTPAPQETTPAPQETTPAPEPTETTPAPKPAPSGEASSASAQAVLDILNAKRAELGLPPLTLNSTMNAAARVRAVEISQNYDHTRPNGQKGTKALVEQGLSYSYAAECIGHGQSSASEIANDWLNSDGHYKKITDTRVNNAGIANCGTYWVLLLMN